MMITFRHTATTYQVTCVVPSLEGWTGCIPSVPLCKIQCKFHHPGPAKCQAKHDAPN